MRGGRRREAYVGVAVALVVLGAAALVHGCAARLPAPLATEPAQGARPRPRTAATRPETPSSAEERSSEAAVSVVATESEAVAPAEPAVVFARYPDGAVHSPVTASVARQITRIRERHPDRNEHVFMKVGSSETVDRRYLRCFGGGEGSPFVVDLAGAAHLGETLELFRGSVVRGHNSFVRTSEAAKVGRSTAWAYSGGPSPILREIRATDPAWAIVSFGTNDLNHGTSPRAALWPYVRHLSELIDHVAAQGVVPIVVGPGPRADSKAAARWSAVYAVATRAVAESRQVPHVDLLEATRSQPGHGLVRDGVHGNAYVVSRRGPQPCVFTTEALQHHYNVRNLVTLEALDRARRATTQNAGGLEAPPLPAIVGEGTLADPIRVDLLTFTHAGDTTGRRADGSAGREVGDDDGSDGSVERAVYELDLDERRPLRVMVFPARDVDVSLALCDRDPATGLCSRRYGPVIAGTFAPGEHLVAVETVAGRSGRSRPGSYLLVVMPCEVDDADCTVATD